MRNKEYTVQEAAEALDVGLMYVYVLLRSKKLIGRKDENGRWLISEHSITARKQLGERNAKQPGQKQVETTR